MSDLTITLIALVGFGAGLIVGHVYALMTYSKRRRTRSVPPVRNYLYDPKQFRR